MLGNPYSRIWEIFAGGIRNRGKFYSLKRNPGLWNPEYSSRNSESPTRLESRIQVLLTKTGVQYLQSGIHCMESRIQDCPGFRDGASLGLCSYGTTLTPKGGGTRPIFGYGWAAEGLKPWPCLGQKIPEIHILFRKTSSILVPCLGQLPQFYY